jgi:hypothetical protein
MSRVTGYFDVCYKLSISPSAVRRQSRERQRPHKGEQRCA